MSGKSAIEWTDATWNPVRGCVKVSPGCKHCYAEAFAERFRGVKGHPYEQGFDPRLVPSALDWPLRRKKPLRIFVNSMSDLFGPFVPDEYVAAVFGVMAAAHEHSFQVLTKRQERMRRWFEWIETTPAVDANMNQVTNVTLCIDHLVDAFEKSGRGISDQPRMLVDDVKSWPLPNVHLGVSVEDRKHGLPRIDVLRTAPARVRFVSVEPLLEDLGDVNFSGIDQVIVGAESGRGARSMSEDWVRRVRDCAKRDGAGFFYKQKLDDRGRKVSLPVLDGRQWAEQP